MNAPFTLRALCVERTRSSRRASAALVRSIAAFAFSMAVLSVGLPTVASAQNSEDPFAGIEEMVVVGTAASSLFQNQEVSAIAFD